MNICFSGGAKGSDIEWGKQARKNGHKVIHYSFLGHYTRALSSELVILTPEQLREADDRLVNAAPKLKKYYSRGLYNTMNDITRNLLRRNWWQVKDSERVYAISTIKDGIVQGGTAWAVQMFIDRFDLNALIDCNVYDKELAKWFSWEGSKFGWVHNNNPAIPHGRWTGIGSRDLNPAGRKAINDLFHK